MSSSAILIPVRNEKKHISRMRKFFTLVSMDFEIIIVNDGSSDGSLNELEKWAKTESRLTILSQPPLGIAHALNFGLRSTKADWIFRMDADDFCSPTRFIKQCEYQSIDNLVGLFSDFDTRNSNGSFFGRFLSPVSPLAMQVALLKNSRLAHGTAMLRRQAIVDAGFYKQDDFPCEDLGLWFRLNKIGDLYSIPEVLYTWTVHSQSVTSRFRDLVTNKKKTLISRYFRTETLQNILLSNWDELIKTMDKAPFGNSRVLMFLEECLRMPNKSKEFNSHIVISLLKRLNLTSTRDTAKELYYYSKRQLRRKI